MKTVLKTHGGKHYLAPWIVEQFPSDYERLTYVEPYVGGASVYLHKNVSDAEVINDIDSTLIDFYMEIKYNCDKFIEQARKVQYTEEVFKKTKLMLDCPLKTFMMSRMSRGGLQHTFAYSKRTRGGLPGDVNAWNTAINRLKPLSERLRKTTILNKDALAVIEEYDSENTLFYLDPPYLHTTRTAKSTYKHEMSDRQHGELLDYLVQCKGHFILSGYHSALYDSVLQHCTRIEKDIANHAGQNKNKQRRTEVVWKNF